VTNITEQLLRERDALRQRVAELEHELSICHNAAGEQIARLIDYYGIRNKEATLLVCLVRAHGAPLDRATLAEAIGSECDDLRNIDSYVKRIRRMTRDFPLIDTIYGVGYRIVPEAAAVVRKVMDGTLSPSTRKMHVRATRTGKPHECEHGHNVG